ncbi:murein biosynthesis integral membrane protein MurJ [Planococcus glaciei]|uniref:murein biosynthesis integral membrane protein MurJ n=1 Tax=Planococcus glaciei TaxID=459472 RepID=UPI001C73D81E|nr:lipid II flippase MurJ [Planococcus glaciei]MBX0316850.1 polysaccharide biosynthesis C-terminal domain-containing protein [Planococcus glaciei]
MNKINIFKVIGTVAVINILARLLGFFRELVIGYQFGTSEIADMIITVYTVPNFLYIVVGGAITTAFISIFMSVNNQTDHFLQNSLKFILFVGIALTFLTFAFMWSFKEILFSSYVEDHEELLNSLLLWMIPSTFFLIISTWMNGVLNSQGKFAFSTLSSFFYNLVFLVIAVMLSFLLGAMSYGIGALVASVVMVMYLNCHVHLRALLLPLNRFKATAEIKRMVWLALPIILGGATIQFYFIIHRYFSLQLADGFVAAVNYASKLTQFPQALLMTVVTTVLYPLITKGVKEGDQRFIKSIYFRGLRVLGLLLIPASAFIWIYGPEMIELIYEHGNFDASASKMTAPLLKIFGLSLFFISANTYMTRFFYANEISSTPVIISIISVFGVNVLVILSFIDQYGASAIAWATVISSIFQFLLLLFFSLKLLKFSVKELSWIGKDLILFSIVLLFLMLGRWIFSHDNALIMMAVGIIALLISYVISIKFLKISLKNLLLK